MQKYLYFGVVHPNLETIITHTRATQADFNSFRIAFTSSLEVYWAKSFEMCYNPIDDIRIRHRSADCAVFQFKRTDLDGKMYIAISDLGNSMITSSPRFYKYFKKGWFDVRLTSKKSDPIQLEADIISIYTNDVCANSGQQTKNKKPIFELSNVALNEVLQQIKKNTGATVVNKTFRMNDILLELDNGEFATLREGDGGKGTYRWDYSTPEETVYLQHKYSIDKRWEDSFHED